MWDENGQHLKGGEHMTLKVVLKKPNKFILQQQTPL